MLLLKHFTLYIFQTDGDIFLYYTSNFSEELTTQVKKSNQPQWTWCINISDKKNIPESS